MSGAVRPRRLGEAVEPSRPEADRALRRLYKRKRWAGVRRAAFVRDGYVCRMCRRVCSGKFPSPRAPVCDHIELARDIVERGGEDAFYALAGLQTLCAGCHDGAKQGFEKRGFSLAVGADGWPVDPAHPANRAEGG